MSTRKGNDEKRVERAARPRWVPVAKMKVSPVAQRELKEARVDYLAANFDPEQIGTPTVNERDGWFYVIDGQHRIEAYKRWVGAGWEDQQVFCSVYTDLSDEEMADRFDRLNDVLAVHGFDKFRIRVNAGREIESDIDRIVRALGLKISRDADGISAVGTLTKVYKRAGAATTSRSLRIIRDAYGTAGFEAFVIDGVAHLCQRYNGDLNDDDAIKKLGDAHGGVNGLLGKAEALRRSTGNQKAHCVAAAAVDIINAGRRGSRLPSWWKS